MENGFGTQDIITGRGLGIGGFGYGYGYGQGFANPSANAVRINRNNEVSNVQEECSRDVVRDGLASVRNTVLETTTRAENQTGFQSISDKMFNAEILRGQERVEATRMAGDNRLEVADRLADMRAEAAKCCCDQKILTIEEGTKTRELMQALDKEGILRDLNRAERRLETQTMLNGVEASNDRQTSVLLAHLGHGHGRG